MKSDIPEPIQLLTPEGEWVGHPDYPLDLSEADVRGVYRDLVLVRRLDAEATALQRQGELGIWASCLGQEAAQVGSGLALRESDHAFPTYREHGVAWTRGIAPLDLMRMFRGVTHGGWDTEEHKFGLYTIVIGNQALHGVGYAMGVQFDGADEAVLTYFGDGATSQGDVNEAFVFAAVFNAPVVFFCQNNQWAISQPLDRQSRVPIYQRAAGFGFPGIRVDGNDVFAVMAVTKAALNNARNGQGPSLIEAFTYRMGAHTTSDDPTRYRHEAELEEWKLRDPIERVKAYLVRNDLVDHQFFADLDTEAEELAVEIRQGVRSMVPPDPSMMFTGAYAEVHDELDREKAEFESYLASFVEESV